MRSMRIRCPSCRSFVLAPDVNPRQRVALCRSCGALFGPGAGERGRGRQGARTKPDGVEVLEASTGHATGYRSAPGSGGLRVRAPWAQHAPEDHSIGPIKIGVAWLYFVALVSAITAIRGDSPWVAVALGAGLAVFPLGALVWSVVRRTNRTTLHIVGSDITLEHGPNTWVRREHLHVGDLRRPRARVDRKGRRRWVIEPGERLLTALSPRIGHDSAVYVEWLVEQFLGAREAGVPLASIVGPDVMPRDAARDTPVRAAA